MTDPGDSACFGNVGWNNKKDNNSRGSTMVEAHGRQHPGQDGDEALPRHSSLLIIRDDGCGKHSSNVQTQDPFPQHAPSSKALVDHEKKPKLSKKLHTSATFPKRVPSSTARETFQQETKKEKAYNEKVSNDQSFPKHVPSSTTVAHNVNHDENRAEAMNQERMLRSHTSMLKARNSKRKHRRVTSPPVEMTPVAGQSDARFSATNVTPAEEEGVQRAVSMPGAHRVRSRFQNGESDDSSEDDYEFGLNVGQDAVSPDETNREETLAIAAEVARDEDEIVEETKKKMMEGIQEADIVPPEKFFSFRNRMLMLSISGILLVSVGVVVALVYGLGGDNNKTESTSLDPPPELVEILSAVSASEDLTDPTSPRYHAASWLAWNDTYHLDYDKDRDLAKERYIVALVYFLTNGDEWLKQHSFLSEISACDWNDGMDAGVFCEDDNEQVVSKIALESNGLNGPLAEEITFLANLREIRLRNNSLIGSFPRDHGKLIRLEVLDVAGNGLEGTLTQALFDLPNLHTFWMSDNKVGGTIPNGIGNATNLHSFKCSRCSLSGTLPSSLFSLTNLETVVLGENELWNIIPLLDQSINLKFLHLNDNDLQGSLANKLERGPPNLIEFVASNNDLTGTLPIFTRRQRTLEYFDVKSNSMSGDLVNFFSALPGTLKELILDDNNFSGALPSSIGLFQNLTDFSARDNDITGTIPSEIGLATSLVQRLHLKSNLISGTIPSEIGLLHKLFYLNIAKNKLVGTITTQLGQMKALGFLSLSNNELEGSIPPEVAILSNLEALHLDGNKLTGSLPKFSSKGAVLKAILVNNTRLTGKIDDFFTNTPRTLQNANLANCMFSGTIPASIGEFTSLKELFVNNNIITGTLPSEIGLLSNILKLFWYTNQIQGTIPTETGLLSNLKTLLLSSNQFVGTVPSGLGACTHLEVLELFRNKLTGTIPSTIGRLSHLSILTLYDNLLTGRLPSFAGSQKLHTLAVAFNALTGSLDDFFDGTPPTALTTALLGQNDFTGTIPSSVGHFSNLDFLYLSRSNLSGTIPPELGKCTILSNLYLSGNKLTGSVSAALTDLTILDNLFVNDNRLTGGLDFFCGQSESQANVVADCLAPADLSCPCCNQCCNSTVCCNLEECEPQEDVGI